MQAIMTRAAALANANAFQNFIVGVIVANAVVIGLETYDVVVDRWGHVLHLLNHIMLAVFCVELFVRLLAVGFNPLRFFRGGWNAFDFFVVAASFVPGLAANSTTLRLVRLLRVTRLLRLMPDVRVLLDGLRRAAPPAMSLVGLTTLLCYLYAVVGWSMFGEKDPERWGNIGEAMLTLFTLLTLEGWNEILLHAREASPFGVVFILSFILVGTFVVLNLVIGVVITSLDEAYKGKRADEEGPELSEAIDEVRNALDRLERRIAGTPGDPRMWERETAPTK